MTDAATIHLSLVSHTNAGKTTLARTLLGADVGEVRDAAHVTQHSDGHTLIETSSGDRLVLWDTPGFGDSQRLAKRLALAGNPLGWLLTEVWDRWRDQAFWLTQRAIRHAAETTDVLLYLINASEAPEDVAWLDAELHLLTLLKRPVIVLLNQLGAPLPPHAHAAEIDRWRQRLSAAPVVRETLALDAFARCWVQEGTLLGATERVVPPERTAAMRRLRTAWQARGEARWHAAMHTLARHLSSAAQDRQIIGPSGWSDGLRRWGSKIGAAVTGHDAAASGPEQVAEAALATRLDRSLTQACDELIRLHGLGGSAGPQVHARVQAAYAVEKPIDESKAAVWGGAITGAVAGLKADLATGGLTLGGGMLLGGLLGALGGAGAARGFNRLRGVEQTSLAWSDEALNEALVTALLTYLAVAHYGRGRGDYQASEHPPHWAGTIRAALQTHAALLNRCWLALREQQAAAHPPAARSETAQATTADAANAALLRQVTRLCADVLRRLYPDAPPLRAAEP